MPHTWSGMWWLQFGHGGEAVENATNTARYCRTETGFNSATAVRPWKTTKLTQEIHDGLVLQFGHGGEAVENRDAINYTTVQRLLQFGHGGEAVENGMSSASTSRRSEGFNSATAVRPWKTVFCRAPNQTLPQGFNSATAVRPWKTRDMLQACGYCNVASIRPRR